MTSSGNTFEKAAIVEHLEKFDTDPVTGEVLEYKVLIPNHAMRRTVEQFRAAQKSSPLQSSSTARAERRRREPEGTLQNADFIHPAARTVAPRRLHVALPRLAIAAESVLVREARAAAARARGHRVGRLRVGGGRLLEGLDGGGAKHLHAEARRRRVRPVRRRDEHGGAAPGPGGD